MDVRVVISGEKSWRCAALAERITTRLLGRYGDGLVVVHDGAGEAQNAIDQIALTSRIRRDVRPISPSSGPDLATKLRSDMLQGAAFLLLLHRNLAWSRRCRTLAVQALGVGVPVWLIDAEDAEPRRLHVIPFKGQPAGVPPSR